MHLDVTNLDIHQVRTHDMSTANRIQIESSPLFSSEVTFAKTLLFPQMVKLCWAHGLYDAIFYVYNRGMRDYTTPLEVFLEL